MPSQPSPGTPAWPPAQPQGPAGGPNPPGPGSPAAVSTKSRCANTLFYFFKDFIYLLFLERGEGREKKRERNINMWLPLMCPQLGTWPTTQACTLTGN